MSEWGSLQLLRHARHDWLNDIQLINAYLSMGRMEQAKEVIEAVTATAYNHSKLTSMNIPNTAEMLITYNWEAHVCTLQVEVIGQVEDLSCCENQLFSFLQQLLACMEQAVDQVEENSVLITFLLNEEGHFLTVDFSGRLTNIDMFDKDWIQTYFIIHEYEANVDHLTLTVRLS